MLYNMPDLTALELRGYGGKINLERVLDNRGTELDGGRGTDLSPERQKPLQV